MSVTSPPSPIASLLSRRTLLRTAAALTVDQWLAIDVTPNQEQVGALMKLLSTPPGGPR